MDHSGLRLRSSAKRATTSPAFGDRTITTNDEHSSTSTSHDKAGKFLARHTIELLIVQSLLCFALGMIAQGIGSSAWFFKEGDARGGAGGVVGDDGAGGENLKVSQSGTERDINNRTQSAGEGVVVSTARRRVTESELFTEENPRSLAAAGEESVDSTEEVVVARRSSASSISSGDGADARERNTDEGGGDNSGKELVLHPESVARLAENGRVSSSHLSPTSPDGRFFLPSTHLLQPLPTDDLALFQTLSFNMLATQQKGLNALEALYNRLKTIRLSPQRAEERQQQYNNIEKQQKRARAKGEAEPPTPLHLDFLDPELPSDEVADAHANVLIQLYNAYTAQFSAVLAHLAYVREKTRIENFLKKKRGPAELSPETGGPSVAELVGPLEAWHHPTKNIATDQKELETFNDILARALRGEDPGKLTMQEQTRAAAQEWEARAALDRAWGKAEHHAAQLTRERPSSPEMRQEIDAERTAFLEKEMKNELVRILKPPVRRVDGLMELPPHSGAYSHPALEKALAEARKEKRQQLPPAGTPKMGSSFVELGAKLENAPGGFFSSEEEALLSKVHNIEDLGKNLAHEVVNKLWLSLGPLGEMMKTVIEDGKGLLYHIHQGTEGMALIGLHLIFMLLEKIGIPIDAVVNAIEGLVVKLMGVTIKTPLVSLISSAPGGAFLAMPVAEGVITGISHLFFSEFLKLAGAFMCYG